MWSLPALSPSPKSLEVNSSANCNWFHVVKTPPSAEKRRTSVDIRENWTFPEIGTKKRGAALWSVSSVSFRSSRGTSTSVTSASSVTSSIRSLTSSPIGTGFNYYPMLSCFNICFISFIHWTCHTVVELVKRQWSHDEAQTNCLGGSSNVSVLMDVAVISPIAGWP